MSQAGLNSFSGTSGAITFITDSGSATPSGGNLNVNGAGGTSTSGSGNTIHITSTSDFVPNQIIQFYDDFTGQTGGLPGWVDWSGNGLATFATSSTHPGQIIFNTDTSWLSQQTFNGNSQMIGWFVPTGGTCSANWVFDLTTLANVTNNYTTYIGWTDYNLNFTGTGAVPDSGIYFQYNYNVNSGNWQIVTNNGGVTTVTNTSIAAATGFHNYGILVNAAGSSVSYTINGISAGTIATNIPTTVKMVPTFYSIVSAGNLPAQSCDLFYLTQTLTSAR